MTITVNQRTYVGMSSLLMKRKSDGVVLTWPVPNNFVLNTNIEQKIQMGRNAQGRAVRTGTYVTSETPEISINYSYIQPEMISFNTGNQMASGTFESYIPKSLEVTRGSYAGDSAGFILEGVVADDPRVAASITKGDLSVALTRQPFASFDPATVESYALGVDGAMLFSDDLVSEKAVVSILVPHSVSGIRLSDVLVGPHELYATLIDTRNKVSIFEALNVTPNISGKSIDFGGEGLEISLYLNALPGSCTSWNIISVDPSVGGVACAT